MVGFGASFGRVIFLSLFWRKMNHWGALFGMIVGAVTVIVLTVSGLDAKLYSMVPGFAFNLIISMIVSIATYKHHAGIEEEFNDSLSAMKKES